jgi:ribonucleotide monophosphatase NagD (HAD superfamily)
MPLLVQAVVAGFDGRFSYYKLATAVNYLRYGGAAFVATNRDATFPDANMIIAGESQLHSDVFTLL